MRFAYDAGNVTSIVLARDPHLPEGIAWRELNVNRRTLNLTRRPATQPKGIPEGNPSTFFSRMDIQVEPLDSRSGLGRERVRCAARPSFDQGGRCPAMDLPPPPLNIMTGPHLSLKTPNPQNRIQPAGWHGW
jgi:hypothetical protein